MIALDNGDKIRGDASVATVVDYLLHGSVGVTITQLADGQLAATIGDLYTAGAADIAVHSITLVNTDTVARTVNLYLTPSGGTARRLIPKNLSLGAGYSLTFDGQKIQVMDTSGNILTSINLASPTFSGTVTISSLTASEIVATDAAKALVSLAVATYPSLAELAYVKGVTSALQTQMNLKAPLISPSFTTPNLGAATLGGTLTLNGQVFDAGTGSAQINTTGAGGGVGLTIQNTQDDPYGVWLYTKHISASPAIGDILFRHNVVGKNSIGGNINYLYFDCLITSPTSTAEVSELKWTLANTGDNLAMTLSGAGALWIDLSVDTLTYKVSGTQVVSARGAAVADATDAPSVILRLNDLLARLRTHGLIAT